jgi:hypothetical protein
MGIVSATGRAYWKAVAIVGTTNNKSKTQWNAKRYTQVKVSINPDVAAAFKATCECNEVSMAKAMTTLMSEYSGLVRLKEQAIKSGSKGDRFGTRRKRRKELDNVLVILEMIKEGEEEYRSNIPENLQNSVRYDAADHCIDTLENAITDLSDAY